MDFAKPFLTIFLGLALGYAVNRLVEIRSGLARRAEDLRLLLQRFALLVVNPIAFCGAVWSLDLSDPRAFALPFIGLFALAIGNAFGFAGSRLLALPPDRAGVYVTCSSFTNIGNIGGLVLFLTAGEAAYAFVPFYKLFEELWYYSVLFPLARSYGERVHIGAARTRGNTPLSGLLKVLRDPFFLISIGAISTGLGLDLAGVERPAFYGPLNGLLIPASSFILLFTIGMRMRFRLSLDHARAAGLILLSKTILVPAFSLTLAWILGLGFLGQGQGLAVVLVLSMMPIGFLGLVPPALFGLDLAFANSLWLVSNGALVAIVPLLSILVPLLR